MTDKSVTALKVALAVLLSAGVIGSIVLLGYATNILVASLAAATLVVGGVATMAWEIRRREVRQAALLRRSIPPPSIPSMPRWDRLDIEIESTPPAPIDDDVQFTVYRPAHVRPARWYPLLAFAHKTAPFPGPDASMIDPITLV